MILIQGQCRRMQFSICRLNCHLSALSRLVSPRYKLFVGLGCRFSFLICVICRIAFSINKRCR